MLLDFLSNSRTRDEHECDSDGEDAPLLLESNNQGRWLLAMGEDNHSPNVSRVSLFVSSPGDVAHERRVAREAIARLNAEFAGRIVLDAYFWEYEPFDFSKSFQEQIPNTATFDVVLCLLWSRLGSRLGTSQRLPDGSPASSGTEYEITHALTGQKERNGLPELHVWINQTIPSFQPEPPEIHDERIGQWRALKRFIEDWTKDSEDGSFVGSFTAYHTIADFQDLFETKLRKIAESGWPSRRGRLLRLRSPSGRKVHHSVV